MSCEYSESTITLIDDHFLCQIEELTIFSDYLHEKTEESRHNETVGYFITIVGSIFFIGGLLETVITAENPEWFLIIPYHLTPHPYSLLGLSLTSIGFVLLCLGIALSVHYAKERAWYMKQLQKAHSIDKLELKRKTKKVEIISLLQQPRVRI